MKRYFVVFACYLSLLLAPAARALADESEQKADASKPQKLAVLKLAGAVSEAPMAEDFPFGGAAGLSLREVVNRLKKAAKDGEVAGVVLQLDGASAGTGQIEELRKAIELVKAANKKVYAHCDDMSMGRYVLLSGVSRLSVVPTGDIWITGIYAESPYLRGLLDKVGVQPDFFTCGAYKSAAEMFMRTTPSDEAKENEEWLINGIFDTYVRLIAEGRNVSQDKAREWIDKGLYSAEAAKEAGIIDAVEYRQQFVAHLKEQHGENVKFDKRFGMKAPLEIDLSSPLGLFKFYGDLLAGPKQRSSSKDAIAIVFVEGPIVVGAPAADPFSFSAGGIAYSTPIREALEEALRDDSIKAVVLRVNSPGGSAVASEIILEATKRVKEKKPLVVSMGDVAGSGGYYVACGTDTIFADSATITGSIGVVSGKLATQQLWDKLGITWDVTQRGENAGILSSSRPFTDEEREKLQSWMDEVYEVFKNHVTSIRGSKSKKDIEEIAGGRVYTGQQALELGLIDQIGGLDDALAHVAQQVNLKEDSYEVRTLPKAPSFIEILLGEPTTDPNPGSVHLATKAVGLKQAEQLWGGILPVLQSMDPQRTAAVKQALIQLSILGEEKIGLTMPPVHIRN